MALTPMTMYFANTTGNAQNCLYPNKIEITDHAALSRCVSHDYVCAEFKGSRRSNERFISCNCIGFDIDNEFSESSTEWITPEKIAEKFPDITYAIHFSRNHMKAKGSLSDRPRFHIIFQTELITNATDCKGIKDRLSKFFPYVDSNALDTARFFFGTEHPQVEFHEGTITLNDFLASQDDDSWSDDLDSIKEGNRNSTLSHIAGKLVIKHGDTDEAKVLFLSEAGKCTPPLPDDELEHIWSNAKKFFQKVSSQEDYISPEIYNFHTELSPNDYSDVGQAEVLSREYKNELIFTPALSFLWYNGMYWEASEEKAQAVVQLLTGRQLEDADMALEKALSEMKRTGAYALLSATSKAKAITLFTPDQRAAYAMYENALKYKSFVIKRRDSKYISSALKEARPMILKDPSDLDASADDLNTPEGVYHLPSGISNPKSHCPELLITKITAVSPSNEGMKLWQDALNLFFYGDKNLIDYVQQIVGLACIGKVYVEALIIAYGEGRNGKSTFWNVIAKVLGSYSGKVSADTLTVGCRRNVKPELAETKGKRLLIASELEEGMRLNTAIVKQLCSTDEVYAEKKYKDPFSFNPSHLTVLYTNHLPKVGAIDPGTWRRLIVIPFKAKIEGNSDIKNYADYLFEHAGGAILTWLIEGAKKVYDSDFHIDPPECVAEAIKTYREDNDWLSDFLCECCEIDDTFIEKSGELYSNYRNHCYATGEYTRSTADFYTAIEGAGFTRIRKKEGRFVKGLRIKSLFAA